MATKKKKKNRTATRSAASTRAASMLTRLRESDDPAEQRRAAKALRKLRKRKKRSLQGDLRSQMRDALRERRRAAAAGKASSGSSKQSRRQRRKLRRQQQRQGLQTGQRTDREKKVARVERQVQRLLSRMDKAPRKKRKAIARKLQKLAAQYGSALDSGLMQQVRAAITSVQKIPDEPTTDAGTETFDEEELYDEGYFPWENPPEGEEPLDYFEDDPAEGSELDPWLQDILDRAGDIEDVLQLGKGKGKGKFKQIWKKVKIVLGDQVIGKGKSVIATDNAQALQGKRSRLVGPDSMASFGRSRLVGPDSMASFGRGKLVGPGSVAEFGKGGIKFKRPGGGGELEEFLPFLDEGYDSEGIYQDGYDTGIYDLEEFPEELYGDEWYGDEDYYAYEDDGSYPYGGIFTDTVDIDELFNADLPYGYTEFDDSDWLLPEGEITNFDRYASLFEAPGDTFDPFNSYVPTEDTDSLFQPGGTWDYYDDVGYDPPTDDDLLFDTFGPTIDGEELELDYNSPTMGPFLIDDVDAAEGFDLLEDQLGDISTVLRQRLLPSVRALEVEARRTRSPALLRRSRAARVAVQSAIKNQARGMADCQALRAEGLSGLGSAFGPAVRRVAQYAMGATAGVVGTVAVTGGAGVYAAGKSIGEGVGTGLRWGLSIGLPVALTLFAASKAGVVNARY